MATNILMPALSPTMTEGTLARWLKREGDRIVAGDVIAEIETDKATMEVEAVDEGMLTKILVPEGTANVAVNTPIALLDSDSAVVKPTPVVPPPPAAPAAPLVSPPPAPAPAPAPALAPTPVPRVAASPLARRLAQAAGMDLSGIVGSGPNGRIVRADIERATAKPTAAPAPIAKPTPGPTPASMPAVPATAITAPHKLVPHTTMRRVIARRLAEAKQTVPHFYLTMDIALDKLLALRADLNARSAKEGPGAFKLSVNDLVIKAAAVALRRIPGANASYTEDGTVLYDDVDISVAVAIPDGLITPIIRRADEKGLSAISNEMKDLAARAKAGKLKPEEFQGGGFSISNLGMFGIRQFAAVINPPQGAILAVGAGEKRAVVRDNALAIATQMTCTLSVDHRVIDGALGAEFLGTFRDLIEDPLSLLL